MLIKINDNYSNYELIQDLSSELEEDSNYIINIIIFSSILLISADENNIIIYKTNENNEFKKESCFKIKNNSYILKINVNQFCALDSNNILKFYKLNDNKFIEDKIIKLGVKENEKEKLENINYNKICLINDNYLCVCNNGNIQFIDVKKYEIKKIDFNFNYDNLISIINLINNYLLIQDKNGTLFIFRLISEQKGEIYKIKDNLNYIHKMIILIFPYEIKCMKFEKGIIIPEYLDKKNDIYEKKNEKDKIEEKNKEQKEGKKEETKGEIKEEEKEEKKEEEVKEEIKEEEIKEDIKEEI